ncbi:MAG: EamA family transporter RarD [Ignavibacteriota bacterium]|nr:EamA family transporter RarD [Ignavibacteriota bacterium]
MNKGIWYAIGAYAWWGFFPIYWKLLKHVPALQLISHRIVWSFAALIVVILIIRQWKEFRDSVFNFKVLRLYLLAAILIAVNWFIYVWAVNAGHIVETSLGYYINPLLSVLMGVIFFREHLNLWQWIPIGMAAAGVLYLTVSLGTLPWIALILAFSFASYGLVKKVAPLSSLHGLTLETLILLIPAAVFIFYSESSGTSVFMHYGWVSDLMIVGAGVITTIPLLLFASAAKRIPLSFIGILQYIAPTIQFLIGVLLYKEQFSTQQFIGYSLVWIALIIFGFNSFSSYRAKSVMAAEME